jgi:hypothetical protein
MQPSVVTLENQHQGVKFLLPRNARSGCLVVRAAADARVFFRLAQVLLKIYVILANVVP